MTTDKPTIEDMLRDYAKRLTAEFAAKQAAQDAKPDPITAQDCRRAAEECEELARLATYGAAVWGECIQLRDARQGPLQARFAGTFPPTDPLDLLAMWTTLLRDWDEIDNEYFDHDGLSEHPLTGAWTTVHDALRALEPDTVEAATAYFFAAQRDAEESLGTDWDDERLERARTLALPELPRPR